MKKFLLAALALIGLLSACYISEDDSSDNPDNPVDPGQKTVIVFDNSPGICGAVVYNDPRRRDEDKIAEIPSGSKSQKIEWEPGEVSFYFSYRISLNGISGFSVDYRPIEVGNGKDQTAVRIDADKTTTIPIPGLEATVSSSDTLLSNKSYLLIQNNSYSPFRLVSGASTMTPDNISSSLVNPGEQANYTINPGPASSYQLFVSPDYKAFSDFPDSFKAGYVYYFVFDGAISLDSGVKIKLENVGNGGRPDALLSISVSALSSSSIRVSWSLFPGAANYRVYRGTSFSDIYRPIGSSSSASYTDTGLSAGTTYYYIVYAYKGSGEDPLESALSYTGYPHYATTFSSATEREVTIAMWDSFGDGWDTSAALRVNVNGTNRETNARLASGGGPGYYGFNVTKGDDVQIYWVSGGQFDYEIAFAVYYSNNQPSPAFNPSSGTTGGSVLISKRYDNPSEAVGNDTLMGSFTVP